MNILYLSSKKGWGGVASWMERTAFALQKRGHTVWIISHPDSRYNQSSSYNKLISKKLGFEYNPFFIAFLVRFIKKHHIDLIVTNIEKEVGIGGFAAKICKIPNIRRVGSEVDFYERFKIKWNQQHLVTKNIVPCKAMKKNLIDRYQWLNDEMFVTIYNGRNPQTFTQEEINSRRRQWGIPDESLIIGITSQLIPVKRIDLLLETFQSLAKRFPNLFLVITGEGKEEQPLKFLANSLGIKERVKFAGFTDNPYLAAAAYDIAVLVSEREGFPNSIVEYLAVAKPVIATNVGGVSELIQNGFNGFLISPGDQKELKERILQLIENKELRETFARNSLKMLQSHFTETQMINELETFFLSELKRK